MGSRNRADIVIGKVSGGMALPNPVFRRNVEHGTLADLPAMESLTGHKMFRRRSWRSTRSAFPRGIGGWRTCSSSRGVRPRPPDLGTRRSGALRWHRRDDGQHTSETPFYLAESYQRRRVIIDTVREGTEPGELQEQLLRPLYRTLMKRVGERLVAGNPNGQWRRAVPQISAIATECFPPGVRDGLPAIPRLVALLTERENQPALYALSQRLVDLNPVIQRRKARVDRTASSAST